MISFDTNIAVHAANLASPLHPSAVAFLASLGARKDVVVCELMLVEPYLKLRNEKIFPPAHDRQASRRRVRRLPEQSSVDLGRLCSGDGRCLEKGGIIDLRPGLTLIHHGVSGFATTNLKDFKDVGFQSLWNSLAA